jgi:AraC family transcriptional regulator, transcriptional activator of pobA
MAPRKSSSNLYDPRQGDLAIHLESLRLGNQPHEPSRTNCFVIYFIQSGSGRFWADASQFAFVPNSLLFFVPYQHVRFLPDDPVEAERIQFHANFLCVETFHSEVGCSGVLFNDPYGQPVVRLDKTSKAEVTSLLKWLRKEQTERATAFHEVMLAQLKVLLILAARLKAADGGVCRTGAVDLRHPVLVQLRDLIEANYRSWHSPASYAKSLHMTPKALGRLVREHLGTTLTDLVRNRMLIHAKWQLLHTLRPVKEISRELGFDDELYFSRLFKKATGQSPKFFREFETEIRGGSNLSMFSSPAPILPST